MSPSRFTENDYVIFVVGPTEAYQSWFTKQLFENHDIPVIKIGEHVKALRCNLINGPTNIVVVSIPSFNTDHEESGAENAAIDWLKSSCFEKCYYGILFLHSLDWDPTDDSNTLTTQRLEAFAKVPPNEFLVPCRIYVVPTTSSDPAERLNQRLLHLQTMLDGNGNCQSNASLFPGIFKGQPETAWCAALLLLKDIGETQANSSTPLPIEPALNRMPPQLPSGHSALKHLADLLFEGFRERSGDLGALITLARTVLEFTPLEHPSITLARTVLEFTPPEHPHHQSALINLGNLLWERFKKEDTKVDLDEVIRLRRTACECMLPDDPEKQTILLELDDCLYERFRREDAMADLEEIISLRRAALERTPPPNRCRQLLNLANSVHEKFRKQGLVNDIKEAISLADDALELCRPGHPDHPLCRDLLASYRKAKVSARGSRAHACDTSSSAFSDIKQVVKKVFFETVEKFPLRLLHTRTGILCNRDAQLSHFERSPQYKQLLSPTSPRGSQQLEREIIAAVLKFLGFAMLSHRWESSEPLLRDVEGKCIYDLDDTDGLEKLQNFCILAFQRNFQWAWSDTCCIDKDSSAELQEAIGSMFSWYRQSSLTIVYLSDVFDNGSLANSVWFKRGWTLQELLASHTVLFYTQDWSLYMNRDVANHKTDPAFLEELHKATEIAKPQLMNFYPGTDDARSRLGWASHRRTTRPEDIAYSLFGIFKVHLPVLYGEFAEHALGRLLAEIISSSGDVSVLDWVGEASSFNSCFPANLVPYQTVPHVQLIPRDPAKRNDLDPEKAWKLHNDVGRLPLARCVNRRLTLPSTIHPVTIVRLKESSTSPSRYTYEIHASRLKPVNVTLSVVLDHNTGTYMLVRPWHPKSLEPNESVDNAVWSLLEQLEQPFNALLLKRLRHNEYKRIASDCMITVRVQDLASTFDSEVMILDIV
ncbi:hypothetical protein EDC04DRAFT_1054291 [Pisolithus marmoratus]|nr:hypothetical protein EDC04DRAFT_1054291 [Pisolithus marmoratus]